MKKLMCLLFILAVLGQVIAEGHYINEFGIKVKADTDVHELASAHGFTVQRELPGLQGVYVLEHKSISGRSKRSADDIVQNLKDDPRIHHVEQQRVLTRVKKTIIHDKQSELPINHYADKSVYQRVYDDKLHTRDQIPQVSKRIVEAGFIDPFFSDQWYLINEGQTGGTPGYDINVLPVWKKGFTGQGVVVTILDDGIDHTHPDLISNYDPKASSDMNDRADKDHDPMPNTAESGNSHGTRCAGEIAAQANNSVCGVGVAFNARIGGVRMLDGTITDSLEAEALTFNNQYIDIYSASWGPSDDGKTMEGPGTFAAAALEKGITEGRDGKGSIFVWATGNGGMTEDDCSCDGYVSSIYTLSVGCISDRGLSTYFSEICPSTMAVIFTGGVHTPPGSHRQIEEKPHIKVVTTDLDGECTLEFQGTSSAAPLAAGCFALVLEANPELTWRDVQHIVVHTAMVPNDQEEGWTVNGAGFHVNHKFGFGAIDCGKMVEYAQIWTNVPPQHKCRVPADNPEIDIRQGATVKQTLHVDGCSSGDKIDYLEHTQVHIRLEHRKRGALSISLYSPAGTHSEILSPRPLDDSTNGVDFTFMTVHNWGEDPTGDWKLTITDSSRDSDKEITGRLLEWSLTLWGFSTDDLEGGNRDHRNTKQKGSEVAHEAHQKELKHIMAAEEMGSEHLEITETKEFPEVALSGDSIERLTRLISEVQKDDFDDKSLVYSESIDEETREIISSFPEQVKRTMYNLLSQRPVTQADYDHVISYLNDKIKKSDNRKASVKLDQRSLLDKAISRAFPAKKQQSVKNNNMNDQSVNNNKMNDREQTDWRSLYELRQEIQEVIDLINKV